MAAQVAPGTPAAGNPTAPAAPVTAGTHGLDAVLGDLSDIPADAGDESDAALDALTEGATETEPATEATPEAKPGKAPQAPLSELLTDEALSTPEGVKAAAARLQERDKMQHEAYLGLKKYQKRVEKRGAKLEHTIQSFRAEKQNHDLLLGNVRSNLQGLHSGDPDTILTALGNLTGQDGLKAFEQLTSRLVNRGKPTIDPQIQHLLDQQRQEIEQLKTGLSTREEQANIQHLNQQIGQHEQAIAQQVLGSTTTPHLTRIFRDDPERLTKLIVNEIEKTNGRKPANQLFAEMEQELQQHFGAAAPQGEGGGPAPKQPATAQRSPGQSVGPRTAAASNPREPTEEESLRALADDPNFLSHFGL
jgi:hypothetical protein